MSFITDPVDALAAAIDAAEAIDPTDADADLAGININPTPVLFNDVYVGSRADEAVSPSPAPSTWPPFPRLPAELRRHIWLLHLRRHRMIEVRLGPAAAAGTYGPDHDNDDQGHDDYACRYSDQNHLGRIVSGGTYASRLAGCGSYAAHLPSLLRVSHEAREAARSFYHIHLPLGTGQVLYLSSEYDVIYVRTWLPKSGRPTDLAFGPILVDFLHDAQAYDFKGQGVSHLALDYLYRQHLIGLWSDDVFLTPNILHPAAAASFADILRRRLRSLLCLVNFRNPTRDMGEFPLGGGWRIHFAQTFPLRRRGHQTGSFSWLPADPRPGVELDVRQVAVSGNPHIMLQGWRKLERGFGVTGGCRVYFCPSQRWPTQDMQPRNNDPMLCGLRQAEAEGEAAWSRDELAQHLRYEAKDWVRARWYPTRIGGGSYPLPKYWCDSPQEAEVYEAMEKLPCTAVGMWLFPAEAIPQPFIPRLNAYNLGAVARPELFLFHV